MKTTNRNFLVVLLITTPLFIFSQNSGYGTVRTDGFSKITFGANWSKRPEAKKVFYWNEGTPLPDGVDEIKILQEITFVRFFGNENNGRDINYIAIPIGEKIYRIGNQWYLSNCGNMIEFWNPVSTQPKEINLEKKPATTYTLEKQTESVGTGKPINLNRAILNMPTQTQTDKIVYIKTKTWWGNNWPYVGAGALLTGLVVEGGILIFKDKSDKTSVVETRTMPPAIPAKTDNTGGGIDSDPRSMPGSVGKIGKKFMVTVYLKF